MMLVKAFTDSTCPDPVFTFRLPDDIPTAAVTDSNPNLWWGFEHDDDNCGCSRVETDCCDGQKWECQTVADDEIRACMDGFGCNIYRGLSYTEFVAVTTRDMGKPLHITDARFVRDSDYWQSPTA